MSMTDSRPLLGRAGERVLLLGNEAVARGALEGGLAVAAGYPGTPSTEVLEALTTIARERGIYVEWSVNEKVALEVALGASMCGARAMATMKHVGLNVASDTFMSVGYSGVEGGLVILVADDPNAHSSQNEQDTRIYGLHAYIPVLEPWCPNEAKEITRYAFDFSEKYGTAVIVRMTTRVSHTRGEVVLGKLREPIWGDGFKRDLSKWVLLPVNARRLHGEAIKRIERISEEAHEMAFNRLIRGEGDVGVVAVGVAYGYVVEALRKLRISPTVLKLSISYPVPRKLVKELFDSCPEGVVVVEELEPVVESQVKLLSMEYGYGGFVAGKTHLPRILELDTSIVSDALSRIFNVKTGNGVRYSAPEGLPPRPPTLCPGCGHRAAYYALKMASLREKVKGVYPGDIGCYTLGFFPPFRLVDTSFCMGSGLGVGLGISRVSKNEVVVATMGDSTFFHAGIPALIDSVYNEHSVVLLVMDNSVTAMTGHQPHPGTGTDPWGGKRRAIKIEDIARAVGVEFVKVIDPYDVKGMVSALREAMRRARERKGPAVVVARHRCALLEYREKVRRGVEVHAYVVDPEKCVGCGICVNMFGCPAITMSKRGKAEIMEYLCVGCGVCAEVCPHGAIREKRR